MNEEKDWLFEEDELLESIRRFEEMQNKNLQYFFDVHELEDIINYYFDLNNYKQGSQAAEYAFKLYPESTSIQIKFAQHLVYSGNIQDALKLLNYIEKVEGSNYEIFILKGTANNLLGNTEQARKFFDHAVDLCTENKEEILYNIGISFEDKGHYIIALDYFKAAFQLDPENISILYDLAYSSEKAGFLNDSAVYYNQYLDEDPFSENVWYNLAIIYMILGKIEDALKAYDYAIALNDAFASAYFNKGNLLFNEERYAESVDVYLDLLELEPDNAEIYNFIGESYIKLHNFDSAITSILKSIELEPEFDEAWHNLATIYYHLENYGKALDAVNMALKPDNMNTEFLLTLANILFKSNEINIAIDTVRKVLEIDPSDEDAWMFYSEILVETSQIDDAIKALQKALGHNKQSSILNFRIGSYYLLKGNEKLSFKHLEKGLKLNSQDRHFFFDFVPDASQNPKIIELLSHYN